MNSLDEIGMSLTDELISEFDTLTNEDLARNEDLVKYKNAVRGLIAYLHAFTRRHHRYHDRMNLFQTELSKYGLTIQQVYDYEKGESADDLGFVDLPARKKLFRKIGHVLKVTSQKIDEALAGYDEFKRNVAVLQDQINKFETMYQNHPDVLAIFSTQLQSRGMTREGVSEFLAGENMPGRNLHELAHRKHIYNVILGALRDTTPVIYFGTQKNAYVLKF